MRKLFLRLAPALLAVLTILPAQAQTAQDILAGVDKVRNPGQPFRLTSTLVEYIGGQPRPRDAGRLRQGE